MTTVTPRDRLDYDERLNVPLRWWVQAVMFLASVWLAFVVALPGALAWGATGVLAVLTFALFLGYGNVRLQVVDGVFRAGPAQIPVRLLSDPLPLDEQRARLLFGRDADARAYHLLRPYVRTAVKVTVDDPADPVPYWLVSTRRPAELAAVIAAARG